jgi:hypothetical protein
MTVPSSTSRDQQAGNGVSTVFTVPFRILDQSHIRVLLTTIDGVTAEQAITTNFTVSGVGGANTTITFVVAPPGNSTITFLRNVPVTQETDYVENDSFPADSHERALDKLTMIAQQIEEETERALTLAPEVSNVSTQLPSPVALNLIGWDAVASALRNFSAEEIATVVSYADWRFDTFTAGAAQTDFTLSVDPGSLGNMDVSIDGVTQVPGVDFNYSGTTLTFTVAMTGGEKVLARYGQALPTGVTNASGVNYTPSGLGAIIRTVAAEFNDLPVNVKRYGAVGDGVATDTAAIAAALVVAGALGKDVFVPVGTYLTASQTLPSGVTMFGEGEKSILKASGALTGNLFILISGGVGGGLRDLRLNVNRATYPVSNCIRALSCSRVNIQRLRVDEAGGIGIRIDSSSDCRVVDCHVITCENRAIEVSGSPNARNQVRGCHSSGTNLAHGIYSQGGTGNEIMGNFVDSVAGFGIHLDGDTGTLVHGNRTSESVLEGINGVNINQCEIVGNHVSWAAGGGASSDFGISIWAGTAAAKFNVIGSNVVVNPYKSGIALAGAAGFALTHSMVANNTVVNCNNENNATGSGVIVYGPGCDYNEVIGNKIYDDIGKLRYGVFDQNVGGAPTNTRIASNRVINAATAKVERAVSSHAALTESAFKSWTPTVLPGTGAITAYTVNSCKYYELEKMVYITLSFTVTNNGTGGTNITASLPFNASANGNFILAGRETGVSGVALVGRIDAGSSTVLIRQYNNAYPAAAGSTIEVSGWYERG